jgi:hypothetical protein
MRRLMAAVAAMALMAATEAAAEDWQPANASADVVVGVEISSIEAHGDLRTALVMFAFARTSPDGMDFMVSVAGFDCAAHTVAVIGTSFYDAGGALLLTDGEGAPDTRIEPGSLIHSVEAMVCQGRRDPAGISDGVEFAAAARQLLLQGGAR